MNDLITTHPAFSGDPETRLRARLDAARARKSEADREYDKARHNLRVFLDHRDQTTAEPEPVQHFLYRPNLTEPGNPHIWATEPTTAEPEDADWFLVWDTKTGKIKFGPPVTLGKLLRGEVLS